MSSNIKRLALMIGIFLTIVFAVIYLFTRNGGSQTSPEYISPDSPAFLLYKKQSFSPLSSQEANNQLAADIAFFARHNYPVYDPNQQPAVVFNETKSPDKSGDEFQLLGRYEKIKNDIKISVKELSNNRIKTSITDSKTGVNIDSQLPSNSKENVYISTLPVFTADYRIYYSQDTEKITILLYDGYSDGKKSSAVGVIAGALGDSYINDEHLDLYYSVPAPTGIGQANATIKGTIGDITDSDD